jgi:hypothetical protein
VAGYAGDKPVYARKSALTIGVIARQLDEPLHRVDYAIRTRAIEPEAIAGNLRIFPLEAVEQVAEILRDIDRQAPRSKGVTP